MNCPKNGHTADARVGPVAVVDAEVTGSTGTTEPVKRLLVDAERGQVFEQRAVVPAGDRRVDTFGRQAMVSDDAGGVSAHRSSVRCRARTSATTKAQTVAIDASTATTPTCSANAGTTRISRQLPSSHRGCSSGLGVIGACSTHVKRRNTATGIAIA
jgi:hypothetical protein